MANRKAQIKTIVKDEERTLINRRYKSMLHTQMRKLEAAITGGNATEVEGELKATIVRIDKNVTKGTLNPKTAARKKSRLVARINKLSAPAKA